MSNRLNHRKNSRNPKREHIEGRERAIDYAPRMACNWRVKQLDQIVHGRRVVLAFEPGREHEQIFSCDDDTIADPFWDAVEYAARCLRGETDPAALP